MKTAVLLVCLLAVGHALPAPQKRENFFDHLFHTLGQQLNALGQTFTETFKQVGESAAQTGAQLLQQTLQQGAGLAANASATFANSLAGSRKRETFFGHLFHTLGQQFSALGNTFAETFKQVGETAAQTGAELLQQTLQQGAGLAANASQTFAQSLVGSRKRETFFGHLFHTLGQQFNALGNTFAETFKQVGESAAQTGAQLLQQTLQQGAGIAANATQTLANSLASGQKKRFLKEEIQFALDKLKVQFAALGATFKDTFHQVGEVAQQQGQSLLQQALQQSVNIAVQGAGTLAQNLVDPKSTSSKRFLKEEIQFALDKLKVQFAALGATFKDTFHQVGEVAQQQGQSLLQQALQQSVNLAVQGAGTLAQNLVDPKTTGSKRFLKEDIQFALDKLKVQFAALGQTFKETFHQVGEAATQQGQSLLQQALQQSVNLAVQGAGTLAQNLVDGKSTSTRQLNFLSNFEQQLHQQLAELGNTFETLHHSSMGALNFDKLTESLLPLYLHELNQQQNVQSPEHETHY